MCLVSLLGPWQIARVRVFIDENLHRTIHAKDLSAVPQRSTAHFSRSFKQAFGEPPRAYVVRRRLERACRLMINNATSLREIALSVGSSDQAHLCRLFRQAFGQSSSSWRRDLRVINRPRVVQTGLPLSPQRATLTRSRSVRSGGRDRKLKESTLRFARDRPQPSAVGFDDRAADR